MFQINPVVLSPKLTKVVNNQMYHTGITNKSFNSSINNCAKEAGNLRNLTTALLSTEPAVLCGRCS